MKKLKNTRKLLIAATALVAAVAVSAGATYAWFTQNAEVSVSGISANVKTSGDTNIMVAVGHGTSGINFQPSLSTTDLTDGDVNYLNVAFDSVTNTNTTKTNAPTLYSAAYSSTATETNYLSYTAAVAGNSSVKGNYVKVPLTIRTDTAANIILNDGSVSTTATTTPSVYEWRSSGITQYTTSAKSYGDAYTAYAKNASRVGFTTASGTLSSKAYNTESTFKVWCPNEINYDGSQVVTTPESGYRTSAVTDNNYYLNNLADDYFEYVYNCATSITQDAYTDNYLATYTEKAGTDYANNIVATTAYDSTAEAYYAYVYLYIWIEGTDGDCFNNILSQAIDVEFDLTASKVSA